MKLQTWFYVVKRDEDGFTDHGLVEAEDAKEAFEYALADGREAVGKNCMFTITQFNKVS